MNFGRNLESLLEVRQLKKYELAEYLGVSNATITNWVSGVTEPRMSDLIKITQLLNCSLDLLVYGKKGKL